MQLSALQVYIQVHRWHKLVDFLLLPSKTSLKLTLHGTLSEPGFLDHFLVFICQLNPRR